MRRVLVVSLQLLAVLFIALFLPPLGDTRDSYVTHRNIEVFRDGRWHAVDQISVHELSIPNRSTDAWYFIERHGSSLKELLYGSEFRLLRYEVPNGKRTAISFKDIGMPMVAVGAKEVWAVGLDRAVVGSSYKKKLYQLSDSGWEKFSLPIDGMIKQLSPGTNGLWVLFGYVKDSPSSYRLFHFNQGQWSETALPEVSLRDGNGWMPAVYVDDSNELWLIAATKLYRHSAEGFVEVLHAGSAISGVSQARVTTAGTWLLTSEELLFLAKGDSEFRSFSRSEVLAPSQEGQSAPPVKLHVVSPISPVVFHTARDIYLGNSNGLYSFDGDTVSHVADLDKSLRPQPYVTVSGTPIRSVYSSLSRFAFRFDPKEFDVTAATILGVMAFFLVWGLSLLNAQAEDQDATVVRMGSAVSGLLVAFIASAIVSQVLIHSHDILMAKGVVLTSGFKEWGFSLAVYGVVLLTMWASYYLASRYWSRRNKN